MDLKKFGVYAYPITIIILSLIIVGLLGINLGYFFYTKKDHVEEREPFLAVTSDFENLGDVNIVKGFSDNRLISSGGSDQWDEHIREIGNIVYNPDTARYYLFYSGFNGEYKQNEVYIGMAISKDGWNWSKTGKVLEVAAEDPYAVYHDSRMYVFYEAKSDVPFKKIDMAISEDGMNWTVERSGVIIPDEKGWQSRDVSSPVVFKVGEDWVMLYEGRGGNNWGKIGIAHSSDLYEWVKEEDPVFEGGSDWDINNVPDDITNEGDTFIMTYHGWCKDLGWQFGIVSSRDLYDWKPTYTYPLSTPGTPMITLLEGRYLFVVESNKDISYYIPLMGIHT